MKNIFGYIEKYKNQDFEEKKFTEVDNLILSQLAYIPFYKIPKEILSENLTIKETYQLLRHDKKIRANDKKLLKLLSESKRYQQLIISDYEYFLDENCQFGAYQTKITNNVTYIAFQGTDENVSGWKEDFYMSHTYPVPAQKLAIKYASKNVKILKNKKYIIGGHSKGGNLALVGAMNLTPLKKQKLINVYSNDGPGLRKKEFDSRKYKSIRNKLINIVPSFCVVGILMNQENLKSIKSNGKLIFAHDAYNWVVKDDHFIEMPQDKLSIRLDKSITPWLNNYTDEQRKYIIDTLFHILEDVNIKTFKEIKLEQIKQLIKNIKNSEKLDAKTKTVLKDCLFLLISEIKNNKEEKEQS